MPRKPPAVRKGDATPETLLWVATKAEEGDGSALREIRRVANVMGIEGRQGGWIYSSRGSGALCQGWMAFATRIRHYPGHYQRRLAEALADKDK